MSRDKQSHQNDQQAVTFLQRTMESQGYEAALRLLPSNLLGYIKQQYVDLDAKIDTSIQMCLVGLVVFVVMDCAFRM